MLSIYYVCLLLVPVLLLDLIVASVSFVFCVTCGMRCLRVVWLLFVNLSIVWFVCLLVGGYGDVLVR